MTTDIQVLDVITQFYLDSGDFNGIPSNTLSERLGVEWQSLNDILAWLINKELVGVIDANSEINPHIIRTGFEPIEKQLTKLSNRDYYHTCWYPRSLHLESVVKREKYADRPYILALALGSPQLSFRSFDLSVLEFYRNDPRYRYDNNDVGGFISIGDEHYQSAEMAEKDQILLETFGFSYDSEFNRAVAVFLRYLADLSPEHQQIWKAKELTGYYKLHPDYYRNTIIGDWGERVPIFDAFLAEIYFINQMSTAMGRPTLFRSDYGEYGEKKPRKFGFLVRPTMDEYNSFILLLDQMLSENINKEFFQKEVPYEIETTRDDGKIFVQNKGTLQILDDWIKEYYEMDSRENWERTISTFREVRKLRQKPAHSINDNIFDQQYFKNQRELIIRAYSGIRMLRTMFESHPLVLAANISIPSYLREGKIWTR